MMDETSDTSNISHPPAVKAGKMRIVQHVKHDATVEVRCEEDSPHELLTKVGQFVFFDLNVTFLRF
ncbi:unnamed protein product [Schistosoma rodhaini]|nr:unnamed protein product [Schistosoma rodhaini]